MFSACCFAREDFKLAYLLLPFRKVSAETQILMGACTLSYCHPFILQPKLISPLMELESHLDRIQERDSNGVNFMSVLNKGPWAEKYLYVRSSEFVWILSTQWLFLFYLKTFYWSLVDLQCCVSFRWTVKWITPIHISTLLFFFFLRCFSPFRLLQSID